MNHKKKKILIVISGDLYIRNYLQTGVLEPLEEIYDCDYIANEETSIRDQLERKKNFKGYYRITKEVKNVHQKIFDLLMWKYRDRSSSFYFRANRVTPDFKRALFGPIKRIHLRLIKWMLLKPLVLCKRLLYEFEPLFSSYLNRLKANIKPNKVLSTAIDSNDYDLIILPTSAYAVEGIDIAWICEDIKTKSLFLVDNWDNLSSKTVMWKKPSHIGVWGEQSKQHAINIQNINEQDISLLGTPRFIKYFDCRNDSLQSHFPFKYILFVGTALNFDEEFILSEIETVLEKNKQVWGDVKVIYRPHPWRQNNIKVKDSYGKNIITDPQILLSGNDKSVKNQPKLDYYPSLIKNAEFVMGGLTSMLIESLVFYKPFLAFVHKDKRYVSNMRNAWKFFEHFRGLSSTEGVFFSKDINDIDKSMIECWEKRESLDYKKIESDRDWFLHEDGSGYQQRLMLCIEEALR